MKDKISIAVCDDNIKSAEMIADKVAESFAPICTAVETFYDAARLKERFKTKSFDLIFLDIDMPVTDGIELASALRAEKIAVDFIFVSNREDRVFDSFRVLPFGFVRKSRFQNDISTVIESYKTKLADENKRYVFIRTKDGDTRFLADAIVYVECVKDNQTVCMSSGERYFAASRMNAIENALEPFGFIRIHSGFLVNFKFIKRFDGLSAELTDGTKIPVARRRLSNVKQRYMKLISNDGTIIV